MSKPEIGPELYMQLLDARQLARLGDTARADMTYKDLVRVARETEPAAAWVELAAEHVTRLRTLRDGVSALNRCHEYLDELAEHSPHRATFLLLRAERRLDLGMVRDLRRDLATVENLRPSDPRDRALLHRLRGHDAALAGDVRSAREQFGQARAIYVALRHDSAVATLDRDLREQCDPRRVADRMRIRAAERLLGEHAYDRALAELDPLLDGSRTVDAAIRIAALETRRRGLLLLGRHVDAAQASTELRQAADAFGLHERRYADPSRTAGALPDGRRTAGTAPRPAAEDAPALARRLLRHNGPAAAADALQIAGRAHDPDDAHLAETDLAEGEIALVRWQADGLSTTGNRALEHLLACLRRARTDELMVLRRDALRMIGRLAAARRRTDQAIEMWRQADDIDRIRAARQETEAAKIDLLSGASDTLDERIRAAHGAVEGDEDPSAACVLVTIEAARGRTLADRLARGGVLDPLPFDDDVDGAVAWILRQSADLPHDQVLWIVHAGPRHVHHAILTRTSLHTDVLRRRRPDLLAAVVTMRTLIGDLDRRAAAIEAREPTAGELVDCRAAVAAELGFAPAPGTPNATAGLAELAGRIPPHITRATLVAGDELADVPFAVLPWPGSGEILGRRFALSDLPCLSVRQSLRAQSRNRRGRRTLVLRAESRLPSDGSGPERTVVAGAGRATLRDNPARGARLVRIDAHGTFGEGEPRIELGAGRERRITPDDLERAGLPSCGTLLLGSCETGMAQRRGRDERPGFVRSALSVGVPAVVAARHEVLRDVARRILDAVETYLGDGMPRDLALQRALRDEDLRLWGTATPATYADKWIEASWWSVWTLYGDPGEQAPGVDDG